MKYTTLGYIEYNDSYLMLYRSVDKNDGSHGKWLGIGGKQEKSEHIDDCFIREVKEEAGINLTKEQIKRRGIIDYSSENYGNERMFLYTASVDSDYFAPGCDEGNLKWIKKSEILSLNLWEGDPYFLKKLISDEPFFVMSCLYGGETDELKEVIYDKLVLTDVEDLTDEALQIYTKLSENQLKHIYEPKEGLFIAETPVVIERAVHYGYEMESLFVEHSKLFDASIYNIYDKNKKSQTDDEIKLFTASENVMRNITGYGITLGVLAAMKRKKLPTVKEIIGNEAIKKIALLEDVMNPANVGAIVRSATALNADAVICTNGCADPLYRRAIRVSMGNIFSVPYTVTENDNYIDELKNAGFNIVSMALSDDSYSLSDKELSVLQGEKTVVAFGTESTGISDKLLSKSDYIVKIPMSNDVDSLNVAAASAVTFWELFAKRN